MSEQARRKRPETLTIMLSHEEREAVFEAAAFEGKAGSAWARDVLISRVLGLAWERRT